MHRVALYFAAPLFTPQERAFNEKLAARLSSFFEVFLPQRDGLLLPGKQIDMANYATLAREVFQSDVNAVRRASVVFAVLDGRTIDEGVAVEIGMAHALQKTCIGYLSDSRVLLPHGINPMVQGTIHTLLRSEEDMEAWLSSLPRQTP